ncbi:MAG TPA: hypothetical protein VNK81_01305, partial [Thermodesulfobacteriota bacterium]|nr:hypothetical protein [Thermodesulfobacteriota bacterium]
THDGKRVYVSNYFSDTVSVIDVSTDSVIKEIPTNRTLYKE